MQPRNALRFMTGIIFIMKTPGYSENLLSYLFGNILMVSTRDLWQIAALDLLIIAIVILFYNKYFVCKSLLIRSSFFVHFC
mgnify:CR=1 FL=1